MPQGVGPFPGPAPLARTGATGLWLRRPALMAALDRGAWLTALVAGPGAGKTTLLATWAATRPTAWLTVRPEHAALPVLRRALGAALTAAAGPALPDAVRHALGGEATTEAVPDEEAQAAGLASVVAAAFDGLWTTDLAVVLDGAQHLPGGGPAARFVEDLCRHAPAGLRLVVASRNRLPFVVDRLRAAGRYRELTDADFAFADFETYQLLTVVLGDAAAADTLAAQLHALAGGRPGLVALGAAWLAGQPAAQRRDRLGALSISTANALAEYLAWELFEAAEPGARELVRRAAYLPRINAELCRAIGLSDEIEPAHAVPLLAPSAVTTGWYGTAAGLRRAVVARAPLEDDERDAMLATATRWYAEHGHLDDALATAAAARTAEPVVELLGAHGPALLAAGRAAEVAAAVARVPAEWRTPEIDLVEGGARHLRGDPAGALACLERLAVGEGGIPARVAYRIGFIHQTAGDIPAALASFGRAGLDDADPADAALVLAQTAIAHWGLGNLTECRAAGQRALEYAKRGGDRALAAAHTALAMAAEQAGEWPVNAEHMALAMAAAQRAGDLNQQIRLRGHASRRLLEEGRHAAALVELDEAMRLIEATGTMDRYAVVRTNRGWAYRAMGRLDEAVAEMEVAARFWREARSELLSYALIGLGSVYLVRGDLAPAETVLTESLAIGERTGDHQALAGLSTLARVRYATDRPEAWRIAERAIEAGIGVWRAWALLTAGWLALHDGDSAAALKYATDTEEAARARHDAAALAEAMELRGWIGRDPGPLREAHTRWARLGNPIFMARAGLGIAALSGGDVAAAEARLRAFGIRPEIGRAAGPLRAAGAFSGTGARPFLPAARAGLDRFAHGDLGGARRLLTDAVTSARGADLDATYVAALRALASASAAAGEIDVALRWYLRLLERDPTDEAGHLGVVIMLSRSGRQDEARRRYRAYTDRMREVGSEPAPYPSEWTLT